MTGQLLSMTRVRADMPSCKPAECWISAKHWQLSLLWTKLLVLSMLFLPIARMLAEALSLECCLIDALPLAMHPR